MLVTMCLCALSRSMVRLSNSGSLLRRRSKLTVERSPSEKRPEMRISEEDRLDWLENEGRQSGALFNLAGLITAVAAGLLFYFLL